MSYYEFHVGVKIVTDSYYCSDTVRYESNSQWLDTRAVSSALCNMKYPQNGKARFSITFAEIWVNGKMATKIDVLNPCDQFSIATGERV